MNKLVKISNSIFDLSRYVDLNRPYDYLNENCIKGFPGYIITMVPEFTCDELLTKYYVYEEK